MKTYKDIAEIIEALENKKTKLISAFPGNGKSHFYKNTNKIVI
jgi:hypothetical protein